MTERRRQGASLTQTLALPTQKTKGWEFTDLAGLELDAFAATGLGDPAALERAPRLVAPFTGGLQLRQVDGHSLDSPADAPAQPDKPVVMPLDEAAERYPDLVRAHLGSIVPSEDPFVARNDAAWSGGAFVYVPKGQSLDAPVELTAVQATAASTLHWRTLIVLEEGAQAEVWEQYLSAGEGAGSIFNTVVELRVGPGASLRFASGQNLDPASWIFGSQRAEVERDGSLDWIALGFGSGHGKVRMETKLAGQGASAKVTGAYAGQGSQHLDFDTTQEHAAPSTTSDLAFRGVLVDSATAVWRGMIRVDPGAQKTDAFQESRNLLLSKHAHADAIPGLEIEADDVRCTHAAAIAQVDAEQLYYLRSRGLAEADAKRLVIEGFMQELVERLTEGQVGNALSAALELRLEQILAATPA
ncbi:MAG: Fe-S cluster assembly protein SufD [Solirubrobacterales bacterium]|nr:Fe-S cluster assembly protein SufD [Solirubrobacterales bacterium]